MVARARAASDRWMRVSAALRSGFLYACLTFAVGGCSPAAQPVTRPTDDASAPDAFAGPNPGARANPFVFVIALENHSSAAIYGSASAPYINGTLLSRYARAAKFVDELSNLPSEPHYIWMEAGTNVFADRVFTADAAPTAVNSTASTAHLVAQIARAGGALDWMSYQEGYSSAQPCPLSATGFYTPAHNPFVFFQDVTGSPPSATNPSCAAHHRPLTALAGDLFRGAGADARGGGAVVSYNFISPDLCHDMHGAPGCPGQDVVRAGDDWLAANLPPLIAFVGAHGGVIFIAWDEGGTLPFLAIGPHVKAGYESATRYDHGSIVKSVERMLGLPILDAVAGASELDDLFVAGFYP
jgi:hypothetical protein